MVEAHWVADADWHGSVGYGGNFDNASVSVYIDPSITNWIAWHDQTTPDVIGVQEFVGDWGNWLGIDDWMYLEVTTPGGSSYNRQMDYNSSYGTPSGHQAVIFGVAADAPNVERWNLGQVHTTFDMDGLFNDVITVAGTYTFDFAFWDGYSGSYGHPDIYLLVETEVIPEPAMLALLGLGLLAMWRWKRVG